MKGIRNSHAAWALLSQLAALEAELVRCSNPNCLRFHIRQKGILGNVVRDSSMQTLVVAGLLRRSGSLTYSISQKGMLEFRRRERRREFDEDSMQSESEIFEFSALHKH
jgi:hypothetical protein